MESLHTLNAIIKIRRLFNCSKCNKKVVGDTECHEFVVSNSSELKSEIDDTDHRSVYMPNGWSYNGEFVCEKCIKKEV